MDDAQRLQILAASAADLVTEGALVGLGTGSTAEALVRELGRRVQAGLSMTGVPTSIRTQHLAERVGIPVRSLDDVLASGERIDIGIDGADEIDPNLQVTKGRGGALLFEKLVGLACERYVIIAFDSKLVGQLGERMPLPIEVVTMGWAGTRDRLEVAGVPATVRMDPERPDHPFLTDSGNVILDSDTGPIAAPAALAATIKSITGVVDHGLFLNMVDLACVVDRDGNVTTKTGA